MISIGRELFVGLLIFVLVLAVSASVTDKLLKIPLFDVGSIWVNSVVQMYYRIVSLITTWPDFYSVYTYISLCLVCIGLYVFHFIFIAHLNRVRLLGDIGYISDDSKYSKKEIANAVRKRRKIGDIPPVYPNGWFALIESRQLKKYQSTTVSILGQNIAIFRDADGESHALDAYCPHMGANLGVGGRVFGKDLECPFHGWLFRGSDGKCTKIPYADSVPEIAKVRSWTTCEINGWIYLWHHAEGIAPTWKIPEFPEITNGNWTFRGRTEHHINAHIEEVPENGADVYHLGQVHGPLLPAGIDLRYMWSKLWSWGFHTWSAEWEPCPAPNEHMGKTKVRHRLQLFGKNLTQTDVNVTAHQIGPGIVYMDFDTVFGKGVFLHHLTPIEPLVQNMVHNIYVSRRMPTIVAKLFMMCEAVQVERDIMIWNNKQFMGKPLFVKSKEDSLIKRHRRWYQQFYSENSPRLSFQKNTLEW